MQMLSKHFVQMAGMWNTYRHQRLVQAPCVGLWPLYMSAAVAPWKEHFE